MLWRFLVRFARQFPKWALVFGILIVSTVLFIGWWSRFRHRDERKHDEEVAKVETKEKQEKIDRDPTNYILVNRDLYDLESGALVFKNWFKEETFPRDLFYDSENKVLIGKFNHAFARYDLSGNRTGVLAQASGAFFADDTKSAVYVKAKDIWRAEIDWKAFTFVNERRVTTIEQFIGSSFPDNVRLSTNNFLVVSNLMKLLRVDLGSGTVKQVQIPLTGIEKRRSPNGRFLLGIDGDQFYCYDVDTDEAKKVPVGRGKMMDYQWLDGDYCAMIAGNKTVVVYERSTNKLTRIVDLPEPCFQMERPSPTGRYVFCAGRGKGYLVDLEQKTVVQAEGGAGVAWINDNTFVFSRDVPDSEIRGSWKQIAGEETSRISPLPFLVGKEGGIILDSAKGRVVLATSHGIARVEQSGENLRELLQLNPPPGVVVAVGLWKPRD